MATRWAKPFSVGTLFVNVYIPLHSGISTDDLDNFKEALRSRRDSYPGDSICMGGDFNFDPWRYELRWTTGVSQPAQTLSLNRILSSISTDLSRFPTTRVTTFSENLGSSSIDHWFVSSSLTVLSCCPIPDISRQHSPLCIQVSLSTPPPTNLITRDGNLVFDSASLRLVQSQLTMLANDLKPDHLNVNSSTVKLSVAF